MSFLPTKVWTSFSSPRILPFILAPSEPTSSHSLSAAYWTNEWNNTKEKIIGFWFKNLNLKRNHCWHSNDWVNCIFETILCLSPQSFCTAFVNHFIYHLVSCDFCNACHSKHLCTLERLTTTNSLSINSSWKSQSILNLVNRMTWNKNSYISAEYCYWALSVT